MKPATAEQINLPQTGALVLRPETDQRVDVRRDSLAIDNFETVLRFAIEKGVSLSEIVAVRRELKAEQDKAAFDAALSAFQAECPVIRKTKGVPDNNGKLAYSYEPLEGIVETVKPFLQRHGFNFTLDTDTESKDGWVIAKCHVTHASGHSRTSTAKFPIGTGTRMMSATQVFAAALTFASRRVFCNAFGIVTAGEDQDGRDGRREKPAGPSTLKGEPTVEEYRVQLWQLLAPVRGSKQDWNEANKWLWREEILDGAVPETAPRLSAKRFKEVITAAEAKLKA